MSDNKPVITFAEFEAAEQKIADWYDSLSDPDTVAVEKQFRIKLEALLELGKQVVITDDTDGACLADALHEIDGELRHLPV